MELNCIIDDYGFPLDHVWLTSNASMRFSQEIQKGLQKRQNNKHLVLASLQLVTECRRQKSGYLIQACKHPNVFLGLDHLMLYISTYRFDLFLRSKRGLSLMSIENMHIRSLFAFYSVPFRKRASSLMLFSLYLPYSLSRYMYYMATKVEYKIYLWFHSLHKHVQQI